jgi:hypothetical protein
MCVLFASIKGKLPTKEQLETAFFGNYDGCGFSYAKDSKLFTEKGFFKFDEFYEAYQKCNGLPNICHLRWSSIGLKNKENCHPFEILDGENNNKTQLVVAHNGTISMHDENNGNSDTLTFVRKRLIPLSEKLQNTNKKWWTNPGFKWFFQEAIGTGNKLVFLDNSGHIEIYNEKLGEWIEKDEIWASNTMYKIKKVRADNKNYASWGDESEEFSRYLAFKDQEDKKQLLKLKNHEGNKSNVVVLPDQKIKTEDKDVNENIWNVSDEELEEIDQYLAELNDESN